MSDLGSLDAFKIFRLLRVLRPLRMINRNEELKVAVNSLFCALPNIFNLTIVCCIIFFMFSIVAIDFFAGIYFYCDMLDLTLK